MTRKTRQFLAFGYVIVVAVVPVYALYRFDEVERETNREYRQAINRQFRRAGEAFAEIPNGKASEPAASEEICVRGLDNFARSAQGVLQTHPDWRRRAWPEQIREIVAVSVGGQWRIEDAGRVPPLPKRQGSQDAMEGVARVEVDGYPLVYEERPCEEQPSKTGAQCWYYRFGGSSWFRAADPPITVISPETVPCEDESGFARFRIPLPR